MSTTPHQVSKQAFAQYIVGLMAGLGPVQAKAMFGGFGIYHQGLMFALIIDDLLYFKVDDESVQAFLDRGLPPFQYESKNGKVASLKYHQAPPEAYDDAEAMRHWARLGLDCALRQQQSKAAKKANPKKQSGTRRRSGTAPESSGADHDGPVDVEAATPAWRNLGPKSLAMLAQAGITTPAQLRELGAVVAYVRTKAVWPAASLNLLWALEGAISDRPWQQVADTDRASLLMALEDVQREFKP